MNITKIDLTYDEYEEKRKLREQIKDATERYYQEGKRIKLLSPNVKPRTPGWNTPHNGWDWDTMAGLGMYASVEPGETVRMGGERHPWKGKD